MRNLCFFSACYKRLSTISEWLSLITDLFLMQLDTADLFQAILSTISGVYYIKDQFSDPKNESFDMHHAFHENVFCPSLFCSSPGYAMLNLYIVEVKVISEIYIRQPKKGKVCYTFLV